MSPCPTKMSPCPTKMSPCLTNCPLVIQKCPRRPLSNLSSNITVQCTVHLSTKAQLWLKGVLLFKQQSSDSPNLDLGYQMLDFTIWVFANSSIFQPKPNHCKLYRRRAIEGRRPDKQRVSIMIYSVIKKISFMKLIQMIHTIVFEDWNTLYEEQYWKRKVIARYEW